MEKKEREERREKRTGEKCMIITNLHGKGCGILYFIILLVYCISVSVRRCGNRALELGPWISSEQGRGPHCVRRL